MFVVSKYYLAKVFNPGRCQTSASLVFVETSTEELKNSLAAMRKPLMDEWLYATLSESFINGTVSTKPVVKLGRSVGIMTVELAMVMLYRRTLV
jgi:hypothetical protein